MKTFAKNFTVVLTLLALLTGFAMGATHWTESFENPTTTWSGYTTGTVTFDSGVWDFIAVYPETSGDSYDGSKACRINDDIANASITSPSVNSVGTVSFYYHRPFTGTGTLSVQKSVDGGAFTEIATQNFDAVETPTLFSFDVNDASNNIKIKIENDDNTAHLAIDYVTLTDYVPTSVDDPTSFSAVVVSTSQINLTWTDNAAGDDVMVVFDSDGSFTVPVDETTYSGSALGGTVIYQGSAEAYNHTSLSAYTAYYYKAWSVDVDDNYSSGVTDNATTLKTEPTNHVTNIAVGTIGYFTLDLSWTDATGASLPDGYLVKGSSVGYGDISAPSDATAESDDALVKNITQGTQSVSFSGLNSNTDYYFEIWPYTNSSTDIDYKTDGTIPQVSGTTNEISSLPLVENFDYTAGDYLTAHGWTAHSGAETSPIQVVAPGLKFSGYAGSGVGNAANVANTGEDVNIVFEEVTSGSIYASFIIKTGASNAAGYFLNLGQQVIGYTYFSRVWVNATGDGVGIGASTPSSYVAITAGVPTLLVVKYTISTKVSDLYVCNSVPSTEPVTPDASYTESSSYNIGSLALRQYSASQDIIVDGIRISTSWNDSPCPIILASFTAEAINGVVELAWETATETNNDRFVIYRNDVAIASVDGAGTTTEPHNYSYVDNSVVPGVTYTYVLADVDLANEETRYEGNAVTVTVANDLVEADFVVEAAYPNPFNPSITINYQLSTINYVNASIYNTQGVLVDQLINGFVEAGHHELTWNASGMPSGVYIVKMQASEFVNSQKIVLMK